MAEVAVDERRLLKTMRWYDGFVIGLANPGFLLVGLAFSITALGAKVAAIVWVISALIGALQAYIYAEPAAMFPDKPGGLSVYAREGWRKHFSLAGPIAVFGYWFAWSSVLAVYGGFIGLLITAEFFNANNSFVTLNDEIPLLGWNVTGPRLIGLACILACWFFNIRGMRPAVWFSYVTGAFMLLPVAVIAVGAFLTGDVSNHSVDANSMKATLDFYGESTGTFGQFSLIMVWLYIIGWSSYGPEAPATFAPEFVDTKNDTRKALASTGGLNVLLALLLPVAIVGTVGSSVVTGDLTGVVYLTDVLKAITPDFVAGFLVLCLCSGLLLSMNTATMDGSRALYALAKESMTVKQLGTLNSHHVPGRAMTLDMVMNVFLLFAFPSIFFILAAGNLGYMLSHVLALSGFLLLRRDRPTWPRPLRLGPIWVWAAGVFATANLLFIIFGVWKLKLTGYAFSPYDTAFAHPTAYQNRIILVGVLALVAGVAGYIIAQYQHGKPFRWTDPSDEPPTAEAYMTAGMAVPSTSGD
jgi:amino acid transporter